ncbi:MAG: nuclear transport factor 2 family protein, partial [Streptosporangiaceae bacterium]
LAFIEKIDQLLESGQLSPETKYKQVVVRVIELSRSGLPGHLGPASKLNRDPSFIRDLMRHGEQKAEEFLAALAFERAWASQDVAAVTEFFAEDAELVSEAPFPSQGSHRGSEQVGQFVRRHLSAGVRMDLTHKQVARERVTWTVRARRHRGGTDLHGLVEAQFRSGQVARLRLGTL